MKETEERVQNTTHGSLCIERCTSVEQCRPTSSAVSRLLRFGAVALVVAAVVMLCASMAALYLWKISDKNVYNVRYRMNINGEVREGSVEIDSDNNLERFKTGSGTEEAVQIHDFQIGITGIRFFGGDKCYIKSQIKANLPHMGAHNKELLMFDLTHQVIPVRFDEDSLIWVSVDQPLKDTSFLSNKILDLCGNLPIYWLQPLHHHKDFTLLPPANGERRKRDVQQSNRQFNTEETEAAAGDREPLIHAADDTSSIMEEDEGLRSAEGSAYNPENPYHRSRGAGERGTVTFDTMLDHRGICCAACERSYTHCQRICQPLQGYWPWPYNYRGCQVACRVIMPCRWWVARILGIA
ncbi:leukocyte cell-derived chemotaxin 1 [Antennarius striatus]|uniref:leukocyte cell-derived chemotaxin 1 n=1 Tax=Antennarius striatus TaxID=241820 RepID=UPI0035B347C1